MRHVFAALLVLMVALSVARSAFAQPGDTHQLSRFPAAAGELGEVQPSKLCPGGLNKYFSR